MSKSLNNSQKQESYNQLSKQTKTGEFIIRENKGYSRNSNLSQKNEQLSGLNSIKEKDIEDFQITNSQLMEIAEIDENENLDQKENGDTPMDVDLSGLDLEALLKSQMKNQSPQFKRNLNLKNNNLNISEKIMNTNLRGKRQATEEKKSEKFVYNLSQGQLEISEEDLRALMDNVFTQRIINEESPIKKCRLEKTLAKEASVVHVDSRQQMEESGNKQAFTRPVMNVDPVCFGSQFNNVSSSLDNPFATFMQTISQTNFSEIGKMSFSMLSFLVEKIQEIEELKTEVKQLKAHMNSNKNINLGNNDKEIVLFANKINLVTNSLDNNNIVNSITNNKRSSFKSISPPQNISSIKNNAQKDDLEDEEFNKFLQTIKKASNANNNINRVENFNKPVFNSNVNNNKQQNNITVNNKLPKVDPFSKASFNFPTNQQKPHYKEEVPSADFNNEEIDLKNFKLKDLADDEFDDMLKNIKNKSFPSKDFGNDFVGGNDFAKTKTSSNANSFIPQQMKTNIPNKNLSSSNNISNNSNNNLNNSLLSNKDSQNSEVKDDEFDSFLNKTKIDIKKMKQTFKPPNKVANNNNKENMNKKTYKEEEEVVKSDFMSGNQNVVFKANSRVKNMMKEMEQDSIDDFKIIEEEALVEEEPLKKRDATKNKINMNNINPKNNFANPSNAQNIKKDQLVIQPNIKELSTTKKFKVNQYSSEKLNSKRLFTDHVKSMEPEARKNAVKDMNNNIPNKKFKSNQAFKIVNNNKSNKSTQVKLLPPNEKVLEIPTIIKQTFLLNTIDNCEFLCLCVSNQSNLKCDVCEGTCLVNKKNFSRAFSQEIENADPNFSPKKQILDFLNYQFKLVCWKYYILSKYFEDDKLFSLDIILGAVVKKFKLIFELGKRSLLMKVAEKDSSVNRNMILLLVDIKKLTPTTYFLEFTDGFKSVFSEITGNNPISNLINKNILVPGLKVNIGLAKVDKVTEDFSLYINIYYNSISKADSSAKLGANNKSKFLLKNLANLREDGGEVSLIDVVVLKKYEYFCTDYSKKEKFSSDKLQKLIEEFKDNMTKDYDSYQEDNHGTDQEDIKSVKRGINSENLHEGVKGINRNKNVKNTKRNENVKFPYENITYVFKIVSVDSLLYLNSLNEINSNSQFSLKKTLKPKLMKKCVIEFKVKNKEIFDMITQGNRYQIGLLNISKNSKDQANVNIKHDPKCLNLKASDSVLIKEIKLTTKKDIIYQNLLTELGQLTNVMTDEIEVTDYLMENYYNRTKLTHEEVSLAGVYISHLTTKKEDGYSCFYLFLVNKNNNLVIIKVHDENFYDFSKLLNAKNAVNPIYYFKNLNFQIVYYYDILNSKNLTTFKGERLYEKNFDNKYIVIYLETTPYSTFKTITSSSKYYEDVNKMIRTKSNENSGKFYDDTLLKDIMNSI